MKKILWYHFVLLVCLLLAALLGSDGAELMSYNLGNTIIVFVCNLLVQIFIFFLAKERYYKKRFFTVANIISLFVVINIMSMSFNGVFITKNTIMGLIQKQEFSAYFVYYHVIAILLPMGYAFTSLNNVATESS